MNHLLTTLKIVARYAFIGGVRQDIPLSAPLHHQTPFEIIKAGVATNKSYQRNSQLACSEKGCKEKRHTNNLGVCIATRCKKHHIVNQAMYRKKHRKVKQ